MGPAGTEGPPAGQGGAGERLGVFGGTFDPPHAGHLVAADSALHAFQLQRVLFVPAGEPPHKAGQVCAGAEQRYEMVRLAIAGHPGFAVSRLELDRPGPSYTVDTLAALRQDGRSLFFITGIDAVLELPGWRDPEGLLRLAEFVAVSRPGLSPGRLTALRATLPAAARARIHHLPIPAVDVSSHDLRRRVRDGLPIRYLVPDPVAAYIARERLYRCGGERAPGGRA